MKPNFSELFFFSRYMLLLWAVGGLWVWNSGYAQLIWSRLSENDRGLAILFLFGLVAGALKVFPKVWAYEQARRDYAASGRDPEQVKRRRLVMLRLLCVASWGGSLWWVSEQSYTVNPNMYLTAVIVVAGGSLWAWFAIYARLPEPLRNRLRGSGRRKQESFIVRCALPVPKRVPNSRQIHAGLPDYCKMLLASGQKRPQAGVLGKVLKVVGA